MSNISRFEEKLLNLKRMVEEIDKNRDMSAALWMVRRDIFEDIIFGKDTDEIKKKIGNMMKTFFLSLENYKKLEEASVPLDGEDIRKHHIQRAKQYIEYNLMEIQEKLKDAREEHDLIHLANCLFLISLIDRDLTIELEEGPSIVYEVLKLTYENKSDPNAQEKAISNVRKRLWKRFTKYIISHDAYQSFGINRGEYDKDLKAQSELLLAIREMYKPVYLTIHLNEEKIKEIEEGMRAKGIDEDVIRKIGFKATKLAEIYNGAGIEPLVGISFQQIEVIAREYGDLILKVRCPYLLSEIIPILLGEEKVKLTRAYIEVVGEKLMDRKISYEDEVKKAERDVYYNILLHALKITKSLEDANQAKDIVKIEKNVYSLKRDLNSLLKKEKSEHISNILNEYLNPIESQIKKARQTGSLEDITPYLKNLASEIVKLSENEILTNEKASKPPEYLI